MGVYDQRGAPRVVGGKCSIGAYEPGTVTTTTTLTAAPTSAAFGTPVTFTVWCVGCWRPPPDGTNAVTFTNGTTALGPANLVGGTATFTTSTLPAGTNTITATYNGDANFTISNGTVNQTVRAPLALPATAPRAAGPGVAYTTGLAASGGTGSGYTYALTGEGSLPMGLTPRCHEGTISGTAPSTVGSYAFTLTVTDSSGVMASRRYTIVVAVPNTLPSSHAVATTVVAGTVGRVPMAHAPGPTAGAGTPTPLAQPARR